jgi:hypothetical protein
LIPSSQRKREPPAGAALASGVTIRSGLGVVSSRK